MTPTDDAERLKLTDADEMKPTTTPTVERRSVKRMVRQNAHNLDATVWVFECTRRPYRTRVVYIDQASDYFGRKEWKHTATLDPAAWIEHLMNNPEERFKQIEALCHWVNSLPNYRGEPRR